MMFLVIFVVFQVLVASILVLRKFLFDCLVLWSFLTVRCPLLHFDGQKIEVQPVDSKCKRFT